MKTKAARPTAAALKGIREALETLQANQRRFGAMRYRHMAEESSLSAELTKASNAYEGLVVAAGKERGLDFEKHDYEFDPKRGTFTLRRRAHAPKAGKARKKR